MQQLNEYLKEVSALECQLYTQNQLYWKLKNQANSLGKARNFKKPVMKEVSVDMLPFMLYFIAGEIIGFLLLYLLSLIFPKKVLVEINDIVLPICFIAPPVVLYVLHNQMKEASKRKSVQKIYENELTEYTRLVAEDQKRVKNELFQKARLEKEYESVNRGWHETKSVLEKAYNLGIIHEAYQNNMVAVATFYDYLDKGICESLTGPNGAYARYENDVKMGLIINKLDTIINRLDEIISNQYTIASLMIEANQTLHRIDQSNQKIMSSMSRIEQNIELIEFNTRCSRQSNEIMENLMVYNFVKK